MTHRGPVENDLVGSAMESFGSPMVRSNAVILAELAHEIIPRRKVDLCGDALSRGGVYGMHKAYKREVGVIYEIDEVNMSGWVGDSVCGRVHT